MWIVSPLFDLLCIISPGLFSALLVLSFSSWFRLQLEVSPLFWVLLVLCVDVAHVYSTLFRTYFDKEEFRRRRTLYLMAPLLAWVCGILLYTQSDLLFWRIAAYTAVFHFIRQQYGFMMIYTAREGRKAGLLLDRLVIYLATVYPLIFWHTHPRNFSWFVEHDFLFLRWPLLSTAVGWIYLGLLGLYASREAGRFLRGERLSLGKNLFLLATALSWYVGIVVFNGDLAFTLTNVVSHGIPYIALVWVYQQRKQLQPLRSAFQKIIQPRSLLLYLGVLLLLAYCEEALWDGFIWRERVEVFGPVQRILPAIHGSFLAFLVPLLTVPQLTHYILDAFIWKVRKPDPEFREFVESEATA